MRTSNYAKGRRVAGFFRICLGIIISLSLVLGGMVLVPGPVQATSIAPAGPVSDNLSVCVPFQQQFTIGPTCPPGTVFYWIVGAVPGWVNIDMNTGLLTVCPDAASAGTSLSFQVWCTEMNPFPFCFGVAFADVTLNFAPNPSACVTGINPTFYPVAWENIPFSMILSATGGTGALNWSAVGLPAGLSVTNADNVTGMISGVPAPGTCGIYIVTATVTDNTTCPGCCLPVSRDFTMFVDCWSNYIVLIPAITSCDFNVAIGPGLTAGQTSVLINGSQEATLWGGGSATFTSVPCQSNVVMVDQTVPGPDPTTRFEVIGSNYKVVNDVDNYAYFDYARQVLIETGSNPVGVAQPSGSGFYMVGGYFNGSAPSPVNSINQQGEKFIFREWRLPDGSTNPNRDLVFTVSNTGKAIAEYNTYYLLNIISDYPAVSESSWELKDSTASYSLALQDVPIPNFWGVIGGVMRPVNASGTHLMTGPGTVKILWNYDYTVPIIIIVVIVLLFIGLAVFLVLLLRRKGPGTSAGPVAAAAPASPPPVTTEVKAAPVVPAAVEKKALPEAESTERPNFCPKCGNPVDKDADFCKKCGNKLVKG